MLFYTVIFASNDNTKFHFPRTVYFLVCFKGEIICTDTVFTCKNFNNETVFLFWMQDLGK